MVRTLEIAIKAAYRCYAGILHLRHGKDDTQPDKRTNSGYAKKFEVPELFPGRMAGAAAWNDLTGTARVDKPWMNGLPRMIFISDMADSLSSNIPFEYLKSELLMWWARKKLNSTSGSG